MYSKIHTACLSVLFTFLLSACQHDQGRVLNLNNEPLVGIDVLFGTQYGDIISVQTNEEGEFDYPPSDVPLVTLTIDAEDYQQITERVGVKSVFRLAWDSTSDTDGDFLSDQEEVVLNTDHNNPDTDGDGLPDGLESRVMYPEAIVALGVNPRHKDLLVEVDWDENYPSSRLTDVAVGIAQRAFRQAPINNPDGKSGIHLIVDKGYFGGGKGSLPQQLDESRKTIFYYTRTTSNIGSLFGFADLPGRNNYIKGDFSTFGVGEGFVEAIVWLHELGHNLGLHHGGDDDILCKPNYISVMNYNPFMALSFTYSPGDRRTLYEYALEESKGIGLGPVDWNGNFKIDDGLLDLDIDGHTPINLIQWLLNIIDPATLPPDLSRALDRERCISYTNPTIHHDHNDWLVIEAGLDNELDEVLERLSFDTMIESLGVSSGESVEDNFEFPNEFTVLVESLNEQ